MADTDFDAVAGSLNNKIKTGTYTVTPSNGVAYIDIGIDVSDIAWFYSVNMPDSAGIRRGYIANTSSGKNLRLFVCSQDGTAIASTSTLMYICILK